MGGSDNQVGDKSQLLNTLTAYTALALKPSCVCDDNVTDVLRRLPREGVDAALLSATELDTVRTALHVTLDALTPPGALFASEEYTVDSARRAAFVQAAASRLELVCVLLSTLPHDTLFPPKLRRDEDLGAWPHGGEGVGDGGAAPGPRAAVVASSYFCGGSLAADAAPLDGLPPWSNVAAAGAANMVLNVLTQVFVALPAGGGSSATSRLAMLAASLAARAPTLRQLLLPLDVRRYGHNAHASFEASVAAQAMRSVLSQLVHPHATDVFPAAFPCLLLSLEHTACAPRTHGQLAMRCMASTVTRTALRARAPPLWHALFAGLPACELHAWPHAVRAAVACALAWAGEDASSPQLHELLTRLIDELNLRAADSARTTPILVALPELVRVARVHVLRHTCRLVPLLCEWMAGNDCDARALAASALSCCMEYIWPRAEHHVPTIWPALLRGCSQAQCSSATTSGADARAQSAMLRLAEQMHYAGGSAFARAWRNDSKVLPEVLGTFLQALTADCGVDDGHNTSNDSCIDNVTTVEPLGLDLDQDEELAQYVASDATVCAVLDEWAAGDAGALLRGTPGLMEVHEDLGKLADGGAMDEWLEKRLSLTS